MKYFWYWYNNGAAAKQTELWPLLPPNLSREKSPPSISALGIPGYPPPPLSYKAKLQYFWEDFRVGNQACDFLDERKESKGGGREVFDSRGHQWCPHYCQLESHLDITVHKSDAIKPHIDKPAAAMVTTEHWPGECVLVCMCSPGWLQSQWTSEEELSLPLPLTHTLWSTLGRFLQCVNTPDMTLSQICLNMGGTGT